jgi:Tol biopolymer transport system component
MSVERTNRSYKTIALKSLIFAVLSSCIVSCGSIQTTSKPSIYSAVFVSEERGTIFERITTDADAVASPGFNATRNTLATTLPSKDGVLWYPYTVIAFSEGGARIGYVTYRNNATNVMLKNTMQAGTSTQQTFRTDVRGFTFSPDGQRFLFTEYRNGNTGIYMMNAGSTIVQQISSAGSNDNVPSISPQNILFFDRREGGAFDFALWGYEMDTRAFSNYTQGYSPCVDPSDHKTVYFARNTNENIFTLSESSTSPAADVIIGSILRRAVLGPSATPAPAETQNRQINSRRSEIWRLNTENGTEELILSNPGISFASPQVSPDGKWILVVGVNKTTDDIWNTNIFAIRSDGRDFTQLTYHPGNDLSAIWSADGKSIYFVSQRGTEDGKYNVWRINFTLSAN